MYYVCLKNIKVTSVFTSIFFILSSSAYSQDSIPPHDTTWYDPSTGFTYYLNNGQQTYYGFNGVNGFEIHEMNPKNSGVSGITKVDSITQDKLTFENILNNTTIKRISAFDYRNYEESLEYNKVEINLLKDIIKSDPNTKYIPQLIDALVGIGNTYMTMGNEIEAIKYLQDVTEIEDKMFPVYPSDIINIYSKITNAYYSIAKKLPKDSKEQKQAFMDCAKYGYEVPSEKFGSKWLGSMTKEQEGYLWRIASAYFLIDYNKKNQLDIYKKLMELFPDSDTYRRAYNYTDK